MPKEFTKKEVFDMISNVFDYYNIENTEKSGMDFEARLNDRGMNGNNGANEDKQEQYLADKIESFIY